MFRLRFFLLILMVLGVLTSAHAQDYSKFLFNIGGGIGFPQGKLSSFVNDGANFVIGGGINFTKIFGVDTEFMWHDLPINSKTKEFLQTPGAGATYRLGESHVKFYTEVRYHHASYNKVSTNIVPQPGTILSHTSVTCGSKKSKKQDIDVLCQQYVLRSGTTDYTIRQPKPSDQTLIPINTAVQFTLDKNKVKFKINGKSFEFIIVGQAAASSAAATSSADAAKSWT